MDFKLGQKSPCVYIFLEYHAPTEPTLRICNSEVISHASPYQPNLGYFQFKRCDHNMIEFYRQRVQVSNLYNSISKAHFHLSINNHFSKLYLTDPAGLLPPRTGRAGNTAAGRPLAQPYVPSAP